MPDISVVRTEKKYSISPYQQSTLLHRLEPVMNIDKHSGIGGYMVRSLYFDSIYDNDYFDKINGLEMRKKVRLRIYSPEQTTVKLELKQKQGSAQKKISLSITRELAEEMIQGNYEGLVELNSDLALMFYQILETGLYRPVCIVEYHRTAFAEESNDTRITLDSEIGMSPFCDSFFDRELNLIPVRKEPVLEVKYNRFLLSNIKQILDFADAPELAVSKYAMSRQVLGM
ncbi:MAG: polyphosphate polymerase domain-containing protein [Eubacteriales bacterium]|nr:polyphosphate polymerase domain-containing protein [Eubacteriales bacterium]